MYIWRYHYTLAIEVNNKSGKAQVLNNSRRKKMSYGGEYLRNCVKCRKRFSLKFNLIVLIELLSHISYSVVNIRNKLIGKTLS